MVLFVAIVVYDRWRMGDVRRLAGHLERAWLKRLAWLGFPAASTVALEVGVFASAPYDKLHLETPGNVRPEMSHEAGLMPPGVPVATFAIGEAGAKNAGLFAASILALHDVKVRAALESFREKQTADVLAVQLP